MNRYSRRLQEHLQSQDRNPLEDVSDSERYLARMGLEIAEAVDQRAAEIAGSGSPTETFLERLGRLGEARFTAESEVMTQVLETHLSAE